MTHPEISTKKPRCQHISKIGARCHAEVQTGKSYCFFHDPGQKNKRAQVQKEVQKEVRKEVRKEARQEGGEARSREADTATMPPGLSAIPLETPSDVAKLLAETVNLFRCREIDLRAAKAIANMANLLLRSLKEAAQQEQLLSGVAGHLGKTPHFHLNGTDMTSSFNSEDTVPGAITVSPPFRANQEKEGK
ncbi:MAG TPA: hypothetical protein VK738_06955 [Terriglobales bacterium]|nr:hypothetical protein [Terriglobales bacterium]